MNRNRNSNLVLVGCLLATSVLLVNHRDVKADLAFGDPINMESTIPVLDPSYDCPDSPSHDGLEMYFESYKRPGGHGLTDIWVLRRDSIEELALSIIYFLFLFVTFIIDKCG